jgi:hypothetical protein
MVAALAGVERSRSVTTDPTRAPYLMVTCPAEKPKDMSVDTRHTSQEKP